MTTGCWQSDRAIRQLETAAFPPLTERSARGWIGVLSSWVGRADLEVAICSRLQDNRAVSGMHCEAHPAVWYAQSRKMNCPARWFSDLDRVVVP